MTSDFAMIDPIHLARGERWIRLNTEDGAEYDFEIPATLPSGHFGNDTLVDLLGAEFGDDWTATVYEITLAADAARCEGGESRRVLKITPNGWTA